MFRVRYLQNIPSSYIVIYSPITQCCDKYKFDVSCPLMVYMSIPYYCWQCNASFFLPFWSNVWIAFICMFCGVSTLAEVPVCSLYMANEVRLPTTSTNVIIIIRMLCQPALSLWRAWQKVACLHWHSPDWCLLLQCPKLPVKWRHGSQTPLCLVP